MSPPGDESTMGLSETRPPWERGPSPDGRPGAPALTLLFHPDLGRIGERLVLSELASGLAAQLGRLLPEFARPGGLGGRPLADRHLSRQPILFRPLAGGGVALDCSDSTTRVEVDGAPVAERVELPAARLSRGVVLELARRIVLLLHGFEPSTPEEPEAFGLVGGSLALSRVRADVRRVADLAVPVLLRGETGTGKELVARAIHDAGPRRRGPWLAVNLSAVPPSLAASELFGASRGAYTGAAGHPGYFRRASGGTLFLDEVGEAPLEVQAHLLRVLETGEILPLGSPRPEPVDVRVIAATDSRLEEKAEAGDFRAPLLHRLAGYAIHLPPLRQRREDLGSLVLYFLRTELRAVGEEGRLAAPEATGWFPSRLMARLARYDWPGNVRQLRNVVRQLVIGNRGASALAPGADLDALLPHASSAAPGADAGPAAGPGPARRRPAEVSEAELLAALAESRWDLAAAARRLGISRPSLYALVEACPRVRKAGDLPAAEIEEAYREAGGDLDAMSGRLQVSRHALRRRVRELGL